MLEHLLKKRWQFASTSILFLSTLLIWYSIFREMPTNHITVAFLNVGQGDAVYVESPTHNKMLIGGGPGKSILFELKKILPWYARSISTLVLPNPNQENVGGLVDFLGVYTAEHVIESGIYGSSLVYTEFQRLIRKQHIARIFGRRGMTVHLGGGADFIILYPAQQHQDLSSDDNSLIAVLRYGNFSVMFIGNSPNYIQDYVSAYDHSYLHTSIFLAGHNGKRTSVSEQFITALNPQYAVISAGLHDKTSHLDKETFDIFNKLHIPVLLTLKNGTIRAESNGEIFNLNLEN